MTLAGARRSVSAHPPGRLLRLWGSAASCLEVGAVEREAARQGGAGAEQQQTIHHLLLLLLLSTLLRPACPGPCQRLAALLLGLLPLISGCAISRLSARHLAWLASCRIRWLCRRGGSTGLPRRGIGPPRQLLVLSHHNRVASTRLARLALASSLHAGTHSCTSRLPRRRIPAAIIASHPGHHR